MFFSDSRAESILKGLVWRLGGICFSFLTVGCVALSLIFLFQQVRGGITENAEGFVATKKRNTYKKEIGIRKVLGASVFSILRMLNHELMLLVCIANTIALPIAYILVRRWLEAFEYRIDLTLWPFVLSGSIVLLTVGITVSIQSMKSAKANPADSLRYE